MYLNVIEKGLELASNVLEFIRESDEKNREINERHHKESIADNENIKKIIQDSNDVLLDQMAELSNKIITKIELEKLESLINKTESLKLAIDMESESLANSILADLIPLSKYALNRLDENKDQWFLPWMQATSMSLLALGLIANTEGAKKRLSEEVKNFRFEILDRIKEILIATRDVPWVELSDFVRGENENILHLLGGASEIAINSQVDSALLQDFSLSDKIKFKSFFFDSNILNAENVAVQEVFIRIGDKVRPRSKLFLLKIELENFVIEHELLSDFLGTINEMHVKKGDILDVGNVLLSYKLDA